MSEEKIKEIELLVFKGNIKIVHCALKKIVSNLDISELTQEGLIALWRAIKYYDYHICDSFYNFATLCINRQMCKFIKRNQMIIGSHTIKRKDEKEYIQILSLNEKIQTEDFTMEREDFLKSNTDIENDYIERERRRIIWNIIREELQSLPSLKKEILNDRMRKVTLDECAKKYDMSRSKINRMELKVKKNIQKKVEEALRLM